MGRDHIRCSNNNNNDNNNIMPMNLRNKRYVKNITRNDYNQVVRVTLLININVIKLT